MAYARQFSVLLLSKCDRLARNLLFSVTTAHDLKEQHGIMLRSVTEPIDTASPMGAMIFSILASFAAEERRPHGRRQKGESFSRRFRRRCGATRVQARSTRWVAHR